jgi:hypothetical protein
MNHAKVASGTTSYVGSENAMNGAGRFLRDETRTKNGNFESRRRAPGRET